jgi:hypothetical protein
VKPHSAEVLGDMRLVIRRDRNPGAFMVKARVRDILPVTTTVHLPETVLSISSCPLNTDNNEMANHELRYDANVCIRLIPS